jgi:hypothetical protein
MVKRRFNKCSTFQDVGTRIYSCVSCLRHFRTVVPKVCSADPEGSATSSVKIRGYVSVMATLKLTLFFS